MSNNNKKEDQADDYQNDPSVTKKIKVNYKPSEQDLISSQFNCNKENNYICSTCNMAHNEELKDLFQELHENNQGSLASNEWQDAFFQKFMERLYSKRTNQQKIIDKVQELLGPLEESLQIWWKLYSTRKIIEKRIKICEDKQKKKFDDQNQTKEQNSTTNDDYCQFQEPEIRMKGQNDQKDNNSKKNQELNAKSKINSILNQIEEYNSNYNKEENLNQNNQKFDDTVIPISISLPNELLENYFYENNDNSDNQKIILKQWRRYITNDFQSGVFLSPKFRERILNYLQNQESEGKQELIQMANTFQQFENYSL